MSEVVKYTDREEALGYRFNLVGRHVLVTQAMKDYALEKLSKLDRFHNKVIDLQVILDIQKLEHSCVLLLNIGHFKIKVMGVSDDMYISIDRAVYKLQTKLRRWKDKLQDHSNKPLSVVDMRMSVFQRPFDATEEINDEIESMNYQALEDQYKPAKVIESGTKPLKTLTLDEAIMKMELSGDGFLIFRGEEDLKLKVIYRRVDGNYGLILPE